MSFRSALVALPVLALSIAGAAWAQDAAAPMEGEAAPAEEAAPVSRAATYSLASRANALMVLVKYKRGTVGAGLAHDHVVSPTSFTGNVTWDPDNVSACSIDIHFPVTALAVDPGNARSRVGLDGETSDSDKATIRDNALGSKQLESSLYPQVGFKSTSCTDAGGGKATVTGKLNIHGVAKSVSVPMQVSADGSSFSAKGSFNLGHADFGMKPFSALLGALRNDEPLTFKINVTGSAK